MKSSCAVQPKSDFQIAGVAKSNGGSSFALVCFLDWVGGILKADQRSPSVRKSSKSASRLIDALEAVRSSEPNPTSSPCLPIQPSSQSRATPESNERYDERRPKRRSLCSWPDAFRRMIVGTVTGFRVLGGLHRLPVKMTPGARRSWCAWEHLRVGIRR